MRSARTRWCGKPISAWRPRRFPSSAMSLERAMSLESAMRLELDDVHVRYGRVHAVRGVSLAVGAGEIVAVLGANGAGKSSLLKAVMGIEPITQGRIVLDGVDI